MRAPCKLCGQLLDEGETYCKECGEWQPEGPLLREQAYWRRRREMHVLPVAASLLDEYGDEAALLPGVDRERYLDELDVRSA